MFQIVTFYRFIELSELAAKRERLKAAMRALEITGTIILATEGF
jgi:predicted sulfurtransferase